ncbi:titin-like [Homarus americanus]|uniref:titin-like n=1 Tax=Homarus americanus TaxID=6706 RepID=UPI001C44E4D7|nr:titin-like [Homarus americanus]
MANNPIRCERVGWIVAAPRTNLDRILFIITALVRRYDVLGLAGENVHLPCEVDKASCGDFHSIKWYKGNDRVFIFSDTANVKRAEGPLLDRTDFHYAANGTESSLEIFPLRTEDEGLYKCEITYLAVREACSVVQFVNLTTHALPKYLQMTFEDGSPVETGTTVGPFDEGTTLTLICESGGGKPVARVTWLNGSQNLAGEYSGILEQDGTGIGRNVLHVPLTRADLGTNLTCEADNAALTSPFTASVTVDLNVPPLSVTVTGAESATYEGDQVTLSCVVKGARPAAIITWLNGSVPVQDAPTLVNVQEDSGKIRLPDDTYETRSRLKFEATRFENGQSFSCKASNVVLENRNQEPMDSMVSLDVHYAPIVRVSPENVTVNESMDVLIFCQYSANPAKLSYVYWYQDGRQVNVAGSSEKYGNGNVDHPSLLIKNSSAADMGEYTCRVSNSVGASEVTNNAFVSVQYRPLVQVVMDPMEPVSEEDRVNVTLNCDVVRANPEYLVRVRWYLDGELLKELPECDGNSTMYDTNSELCNIDPSKLLLENVFKDFHGNYSCEGMNDAGWGTRSNEAELIVHYPPGQASISYEPPMVVKGLSLELTCNVEDAGRPAATTFRWYRGSHLVPDETTATWTINPVSLETEDNFTCVPVNIEGEGERATAKIEVLAAPVFIDRLPPYHGALMNSAEVSLSCRVECSPFCSVEWFKDDLMLLNDTHYKVSTSRMPPDPSSGDLQSAMSVLTWQMDRWPNGVLDRVQDNANYTCTSTSNMAGPGVTSHTYFRVEYPPEEILVSDSYIQVVEGEVPPKIECRASSYPEATYVWLHGEHTVAKGAVLNLDHPIERHRAGDYECIAQNRHGKMTSTTTFDILFKPECKIDRQDGGSGEDAHILLICRAAANPEEVVFRWRMLNETLTQDVTSEGLESRLRLPATAASLGTYYCYVNNTIGESIPCEIDVTGVAGIMEKLGDDNIIVISAIVAAVIVLVLIICVVIIVICRRQRQAGKYNGTTNLQERENPEGTSPRPDPFSPASVQPVHKWPLRPGVHVHVNSLTSLTDDSKPMHNNNTMTNLFPPTTTAPPPPHNPQHYPYHQHPLQHASHPLANNHHNQQDNHHPSYSHPLHPHQQYPTLDSKRAGSSLRKLNSHNNPHTLPRQTSLDVSREDLVSSDHSPTSHSHPKSATNNNKYRPKSAVSDLDVNFHTGNSVVVQTKPDISEGSTTGRKRKKPGQDPEASKPPTTGPKDNGIPSPPDDDKQTFYENLPFHGMQPPPNKDAPEVPGSSMVGGGGSAGGSRPPSQLSQQASSGYGSTRSRKDVNLNQSSSEEGSKDPPKVPGRRDVSFRQDVAQMEDEKGFNRVQRQNSESYGSLRSASEKSAKSTLAKTAAYFSMRLTGNKRKGRSKGNSEENHQMIDKQPTIQTVPTTDSPTYPLRENESEVLAPSQHTTHFTSETKHTITSQPSQNTLILESSQTSKLTVIGRPPSRADSNTDSIYSEGSSNRNIPRPGRATKVRNHEPSSDPRASDVTETTDTLPTPAPRNGTGGKVKHTYQNIPLPTKDNITNAQRPSPKQPHHVLPENRKTANYGSAQNPTPSSSSSSSSPSSSHYQPQYQTQYQPQYQPHYQRNPSATYKQYPSSSSLKESHPPPSYNSCSRQSYSSSTYPHRLENQSHPATSYPNTQSHPATSYPSSQTHASKAYPQPANSQSHLPKYAPGVVYADLALSRNGQPNHYRRDLNTEYAILQFNGPIVGQEIDV